LQLIVSAPALSPWTPVHVKSEEWVLSVFLDKYISCAVCFHRCIFCPALWMSCVLHY